MEVKNIVKKKKCIPLNDLKKDFEEKNAEKEEYLREYVSIFDLNPKANYYTLKNIPSFKESYLEKYKYTLYYRDAKDLGCFSEVDEKSLINTINEYFAKKNVTVFNPIIKIDSLAKVKIMKLFFYLLDLEPTKYNFQKILEQLKKDKIEESLIFKAPINFGNNELKYYFFYELYIEFFLFNFKGKKSSNKYSINVPKNIFLSTELPYFPLLQKEKNDNDFSEIDLSEFELRKNKLIEYISFNKKNSKTNKNESNKNEDEKKVTRLN